MGKGSWINRKRYAVFVEEWDVWWVGHMKKKGNKVVGMKIGNVTNKRECPSVKL